MITQTTNINIDSKYGAMNYIIKYNETNNYISNSDAIVIQNGQNQLNMKINNSNIKSLIRQDSYWIDFKNNSNIEKSYFPSNINLSSIKLLFPNFSVDTYESNIKYALTINIYINEVQVCLGSYLIDRLDAYACAPIEHILNNTYYEYIEVPIINPYDIMYSDDWDQFRKILCFEPDNINNTGTLINVSLYPIIKSEDEDIYIMKDNYTGSQNGLNLYKDKSTDFLNLQLSFQENQYEYPYFDVKLCYNNEYDNLLEYLKETYNFFKIFKMSYIFTIRDKNNIYKKIIKSYKHIIEQVQFKKYDKTQEENINDILVFKNWEGWHEGIIIDITLHLIGKTINNGITKLCGFDLPSNYLYFTKDILKYFIDDENIINIKKINLNNLDMNIIKIDAVNKIENKIIQLDNPENAKSNITYPIFYHAYDLSNIILHPAVQEYICINLDIYKSKVKTFGLKIKDDETTAVFTEIGRVSQGIIFKIIGDQLPKTNDGLYYIINENNDLVTMGNYKYIK